MKTNTKDLTKGYKGYNSDFTCRPYNAPYQYAENTIHKLDKYEGLECCKTGFHYCINPLDILKFYPLIGVYGELNTFTKVEALGDIDTVVDEDFIKCATDKIKIGEKLSLDEYIDECIEYMSEYCKSKDDSVIFASSNNSYVATSGEYSQIATSGNNSKIAVSGNSPQIATSGYYSQIVTNSYNSQVSTSGYQSQVVVSGEYSQVATSGESSKVVASGDFSQAVTNGYKSQVFASGECSQVATSGKFSQIDISGDNSQVATSSEHSYVVVSGNNSQVATSGYRSQVTTSGDNSKVTTSGYSARVNIQGDNSVVANIGIGGTIKGVIGTWITLAEYDKDNKCIGGKFGFIDGVNLKSDTWYKLENGEFIEC